MRYVTPELNISVFDMENIVTVSGDVINDYITTPEGQQTFTGTVDYSALQDESVNTIIQFK